MLIRNFCILLVFTEMKLSLFWGYFHDCLHWTLSKWQRPVTSQQQCPVQPMMKISSKWQHFHFSVGVIWVQLSLYIGWSIISKILISLPHQGVLDSYNVVLLGPRTNSFCDPHKNFQLWLPYQSKFIEDCLTDPVTDGLLNGRGSVSILQMTWLEKWKRK